MRYLFAVSVTTVAALVVIAAIWDVAHITVTTECERLGAFYVGSKVYECRVKEGVSK